MAKKLKMIGEITEKLLNSFFKQSKDDCMGIIKTKGIVIREAKYKESDKILTVLTPDLGKILVVAKGAKIQKEHCFHQRNYSLFPNWFYIKIRGNIFIKFRWDYWNVL